MARKKHFVPLYQLKKSVFDLAQKTEPYDNWWGLLLAVGVAVLLLQK